MDERNSSTTGERLSYAICDANEQRELFGADRQVEESLAKQYRIELAERVGGLSSSGTPEASPQNRQLAELPRPENITVETLSWYPPILKLSWHLYELEREDALRLDFYSTIGDLVKAEQQAGSENNKTQPPGNDDRLINEVDLEILLGDRAKPEELAGSLQDFSQEPEPRRFGLATRVIEELRRRRALLSQSLSCFQVTYNVINSR